MLYKNYGNTGEQISAIGFGGMRFESPHDIDANAELVLHANSRGINYFDTTPSYCEGQSELIFGAALSQMNRNEVFISTKSNCADGDELRNQIEASLKRLGVDQIDMFHIWWVVNMDSWRGRVDGGAIKAAIKTKEEGLIKYLAISSHLQSDELKTVLDEAPFDGVTLGYSAINFPYRQEAIEHAHATGLGVVTMNPLGGGMIPRHAERFNFIRDENDDSVVSAALRFNVSQAAITCALVGFTTRDHIDQACDAMEGFSPYSESHTQMIRDRVEASFDDLCTGCGYCLPCPSEMNIPQMMDAYNYHLLGCPDKLVSQRLLWHWQLKPADASVCTRCGKCEKRCTQHLPIMDRMRELSQLPDY